MLGSVGIQAWDCRIERQMNELEYWVVYKLDKFSVDLKRHKNGFTKSVDCQMNGFIKWGMCGFDI